jgi:hypothetical protein
MKAGSYLRNLPHVPDYPPEPATAARIDPLTGAYHKLRLELNAHRVRPLRALNSDEALRWRVLDIEALIIAMKDYLKVVVEDTAANIALAGRQDDVVEAYMSDMAGELRGHFIQALERNR